jgi:CHRD domain
MRMNRLTRMVADRRGWHAAALVVASALMSSTVVGAQPTAKGAEAFETHLGHTGIADASMPAIRGAGDVLATLSGQTLKLEGQVAGLNSPATDAHLMKGAGIGIPGSVMTAASLTLDSGGKISGSVKLSKDQLVALRAGQIYVQINSIKSPAPAGHLWGWLLPVHEKAGEDEPQAGGWFLPQGAGLAAHPQNRN